MHVLARWNELILVLIKVVMVAPRQISPVYWLPVESESLGLLLCCGRAWPTIRHVCVDDVSDTYSFRFKNDLVRVAVVFLLKCFLYCVHVSIVSYDTLLSCLLTVVNLLRRLVSALVNLLEIGRSVATE